MEPEEEWLLWIARGEHLEGEVGSVSRVAFVARSEESPAKIFLIALESSVESRKRAFEIPIAHDGGCLVPGGKECLRHDGRGGRQGHAVADDPCRARNPAGEHRTEGGPGLRLFADKVVEEQRCGGEAINVGGSRHIMAIAAKVVGPERIDGDQHDIGLRGCGKKEEGDERHGWGPILSSHFGRLAGYR